jgi:hypothetical protein
VNEPSSAWQPAHVGPDAPRPRVPKAPLKLMRAMHVVLEPNRLWYRAGVTLQSSKPLYKAFTWAEEKVKSRMFGCRMCGQCALPTTAYSCPQSCPKQLRNGPCGGVSFEGMCEVYPEMRCVWYVAYKRAESEGRISDLRRLVRPIDHRRWGQSSWVNFWLGRDEQLWTESNGLTEDEPLVPDEPVHV